MLLPKPVFHRLAQDAVDKLAREDIVCAPDEILWLHEMAGKIIHPTPADECLFLDLPIPCGNVLLWPLSIGARIWLAQFGKPWFAGAGDLEEYLFAFAMAHARESEIFQGLTSCWKTKLKVALWARGLNCTRRELNDSVARCLSPEDYDLIEVAGPKPKKVQVAPSSDYGDCLALLCHFYGETPAYWLWQVSEDICADRLAKISLIMPISKKIEPGDAKFQAHSKFNLVVAHIRKAHKETAEKEAE